MAVVFEVWNDFLFGRLFLFFFFNVERASGILLYDSQYLCNCWVINRESLERFLQR